MKRLLILNMILILIYIAIPEPIRPKFFCEEIKPNNVEVTSRNLNRTEPKEITEISQNGIDFIKKYEGCKLTSYKLQGETNFTIGYGHSNANIKQGQQITQEQAENLLKEDLKRFEQYVNSTCKDLKLNQNEFDALVSFTYNCGKGNLDKLVSRRTKQEIASHIVNYTKSGNSANKKGLQKRRLEEQELFLGGK